MKVNENRGNAVNNEETAINSDRHSRQVYPTQKSPYENAIINWNVELKSKGLFSDTANYIKIFLKKIDQCDGLEWQLKINRRKAQHRKRHSDFEYIHSNFRTFPSRIITFSDVSNIFWTGNNTSDRKRLKELQWSTLCSWH